MTGLLKSMITGIRLEETKECCFIHIYENKTQSAVPHYCNIEKGTAQL